MNESLRARQRIMDAVKTGKSWYSSKRAVEEYLSKHGMKLLEERIRSDQQLESHD